mgnify:CR=1 FL=1
MTFQPRKGGAREETVRKAQIALIVVAFVFVAGVAPVQSQGILRGGYMPSSWEGWYYYLRGDQVHMLQSEQVNWVAETLRIDDRHAFRRVTDDLVVHGDQVGLRGQRGFYPLYQCNKGQRFARYATDIGVGALLGAVIGGKKGAAIGGGLGAAVAIREDLKCWSVQNQMVVIDDPSDVQSQSAPQVRPMQDRNGWNERLRNQANSGGNPWFGSYRGCMEQGMFTLKNETGEVIRVYRDGQPYAVLGPRQSECGEPFASYDAEATSAVSDGYTATAGVARAKPEGRSGGVWIWR